MHLLDIFFLKRCVGCGRIGRYLCDRCRATIEIVEHSRIVLQGRWGIDGLISFFRYRGVVKSAIKTIKYRHVSDLSRELIDCVPLTSYILLKTFVQNRSCILVPIPLHPSRLRNRGFNQAEILGSLVADRLGVPVANNLLRRVKKTTPQVEVKERKNRLKNMQGVFEVNKTTIQQYNNIAILLFDDVSTTGATMRAAASVLKQNGVKSVWGVTMAR